MRSLLRASITVALAGLAAACFPDAKCDSDQLLSNHLCIDVPALDAGPDDRDGGAGSTFGKTCAVLADCGPDTNYCAIVPGQPAGICTHEGCLEDPSVCPDGWSCFDASAYLPGLSLCLIL